MTKDLGNNNFDLYPYYKITDMKWQDYCWW